MKHVRGLHNNGVSTGSTDYFESVNSIPKGSEENKITDERREEERKNTVLFEVLESSSVIELSPHIQRIRLPINQCERIHLKECEVQI